MAEPPNENDESSAGQSPAPSRVETMREIVNRLGDDTALSDAEITPGVAAVVSALADQLDQANHARSEAEARILELEDLADRDPLLDILNRRAFERELERMAARIERYGGRASVLFIDLNKFKWINDMYGHQAGDAVLAHVGEIICANVRSSDLVGRLGGDEFAAILVQADKAAAVAKAERLEAMIATTPIDIDGTTILLTASAGAEEITGLADLKAKLESADSAMYRRKELYHAGDRR